MKKKTKIIIIICIVLVVALFLFFKFVNKYALQNFWFNIQMIGVDKDIIIEKRGGPVQMGVYATSSYDYYIDLDKRPLDEEGKPDLESINALDTDLFNKNLSQL